MSEINLRAKCELAFEVSTPTPLNFMLRPQSGIAQRIESEAFVTSPAIQIEHAMDLYGNHCQRLVAPPGSFTVTSEVSAWVQPRQVGDGDARFVPAPELPAETLPFLLPSRYCESDRFGDMAVDIVGDQPLGYAQVSAICTWVREHIKNIPFSSTYPVSASEVNRRGEGVCRDLAHMCISLCRALSIPARLVVGYLDQLTPMDVHAWFEAFLGDSWWVFDAAVEDRSDRRLTIAVGRDAADVAIYNQFGPLLLPAAMRVDVNGLRSET